MSTLEFSRSHSGDIDDAMVKIKAVIDDFSERYASHLDTVEWRPDGCGAEASGKRFKAYFEVDAAQVRINVDLVGLAARLLKPRVVSKITEQLDRHFPV